MKKGLLALGALFTICLSMLATDMIVKQKNGEDWKINVDDVEEVFFEENAIIPEDSTVVDASETFLLFNILSDSTVEVTRDDSGDDRSYIGHDSITIPERVRIGRKVYTVTSIGAGAFIYNYNLKSIDIPDGVTNIGASAFDGCDSLNPKLLVYDKGTKCYGWVGDKKKCTEVVIPDGVTSIGEWAFSDCISLTSINIPESLTSIEVNTFFGCSSLTSIEIPDGVTSIETSAFWDCSSLKSINVATNNPMYSSENGVIYNKNKTVIIFIPKGIAPQLLIYDNGTKCYGWVGDKDKCTEVVIPESVTSIETKAFFDCSSLTNIKIPESVTNIGSSAFYKCSSLDVIVDNSKDNVEVGGAAFTGCKSVTWLKD